MKAHDAAAAARALTGAAAPVLVAMTRTLGPVAVAAARHLITARYTDPKEQT
ncbi:hypothetical protein [Brachybacterium tyrofermentans]|uniref:hypothetical protein n=1 Tax=Brachybacterium tyrofermentans TaxID=47848 RepID=UPI001867252D|nr:hypothetical protein [Brachybacterium tyrofermentans]